MQGERPEDPRVLDEEEHPELPVVQEEVLDEKIIERYKQQDKFDNGEEVQ